MEDWFVVQLPGSKREHPFACAVAYTGHQINPSKFGASARLNGAFNTLQITRLSGVGDPAAWSGVKVPVVRTP